ncbi:hypothetical protein CFP56_004439 [Quercus suber]|uniref:DNA helicase n=1 Tax=Quercus suber TaxID=58331 RepID=A0AAW0LEG6_QUESU
MPPNANIDSFQDLLWLELMTNDAGDVKCSKLITTIHRTKGCNRAQGIEDWSDLLVTLAVAPPLKPPCSLKNEDLAWERFQNAITDEDINTYYDMSLKDFEHFGVHDLLPSAQARLELLAQDVAASSVGMFMARKLEDVFLLCAASSLSTQNSETQQLHLHPHKQLFLTLLKSTTPSPSSTSATIAFLIAEKLIQSRDLGVHFSRTFLLKSSDEYTCLNSESFGWSLFTKLISAKGDRIAGTENEVVAELKKFSSSRSNDIAKFLNVLAWWRMSWISASAESRTSRQPLDMKENALEFDEEEDDVVARFSFMVVTDLVVVELITIIHWRTEGCSRVMWQ